MEIIPKQEVIRRIQGENPWWSGDGRVPASIRGCPPRPYLDLLAPLIENRNPRRAVVLLGPRRVGKTWLLHHMIDRLIEKEAPPRSLAFVSVDHPLYNGLGLHELLELSARAASELSTGGAPLQWVFFDEIQYLRDWERHLKALVDDRPDIRFVVSGSAAAALRLKSTESGAGRFTDFVLPPLTFHETLVLLGKDDLIRRPGGDPEKAPEIPDQAALDAAFVDYLNFGGYPEVLLSKEIRTDPGRFIRSDIVDKVLLRDLPSLYGIQDIPGLNKLFTTLAWTTSQETSLEKLSQYSGVAKATIKKYIEYLEAAFLVRTFRRVDQTARRFRRARAFKVYLVNPSMRAALFSPIAETDERIGALAETAVLAQWFHSDAGLAYARWPEGEVDLVHLDVREAVQFAVEVKYSDRIVDHPKELAGLIDFALKHALREVLVTTRTTTARREIEGVIVNFQPTSVYCWEVGANIIAGKKLLSDRSGTRTPAWAGM